MDKVRAVAGAGALGQGMDKIVEGAGAARVLSERQNKIWSQFWTQKNRYYPVLFLCLS